MLRVPYDALEEATGGFSASKLLGEGSFAAVYVGRLGADRHDEIMEGTGSAGNQAPMREELVSGEVAVKLLFQRTPEEASDEDRELNRQQEEDELDVMARYKHRNICCLLAVSFDGPRRAFIYQVSLDMWSHSLSPFLPLSSLLLRRQSRRQRRRR